MTATFDNQRRADQGDGTYLNPIMAGDHPDPTVLRDGDDYFMTFSTFETFPGIIIWHSKDLVNWQPIGPALHRPLGSIFALDLCKVGNRFYIYIPVKPTAEGEIKGRAVQTFVIYTDDIWSGQWSEPIHLAGMEGPIDPGHVIGEDGRRYLFTSGIRRIRLTDDGLAVDGQLEYVYDGWRYPEDWITEAFALEGPKMFRRGDFFYLVSAVGGTSGPVTGHMVIVARSRSVHGPWENHPNNPIIRTQHKSEAWWSRGHATIFEGPAGQWYSIYHGYENAHRGLGRQTLLEPINWTEDGWPIAMGGDLAKALPKPIPNSVGAHGVPISDDFSEPRWGLVWNFYKPSANETSRAKFGDGLILKAKGTDVVSSSPLAAIIGDRDYEVEVTMELEGEVEGGLLMFFDFRLFSGMGVTSEGMKTYKNGVLFGHWREPAPKSRVLDLKYTVIDHVLTMYYRVPGEAWSRHGIRFETAGQDVNSAVELASLRPAVFAAGEGSVTYRNFKYKAL